MILRPRARPFAVLLLCAGPSLAGAAEKAPTVAPAPPAAAAPTVAVVQGGAAAPPAAAAPDLSETQRYCQNMAAAAADARFAWQRKQLNELSDQLKQRIADLQAREAALKEAFAHRDEVMKRAADTVVGLYAKMKPDAAAQQLSALDDELAAAILAQLTQKQAGGILAEIPADRAAKLVGALTAAPVAGKKS